MVVNDSKYKGQTQRDKALCIPLFDLPEATREGVLLCMSGNHKLHIQPDKLMRTSHSLTGDLLLGKHTQLVWEKNLDVKWDSVVGFFIRHFLFQQVYSLNKDHTEHIKILIRGKFGLMSFLKGLVSNREAEFARKMEIFACLTEGTSFRFKWDLIINVNPALLSTSLFCTHTHKCIHRNILQNSGAFSCFSVYYSFFLRVSH